MTHPGLVPDLWQSSGNSAEAVVAELSISGQTLKTWKQQLWHGVRTSFTLSVFGGEDKRRGDGGFPSHHAAAGRVEDGLDATATTVGVISSMSRRGNCYDNVAMENFWSALKRELVHRCQFATHTEARTAIFE